MTEDREEQSLVREKLTLIEDSGQLGAGMTTELLGIVYHTAKHAANLEAVFH
jgi:hypothetical protein